MDKTDFYKALDAAPMVPVFYCADVPTACGVLRACYEGGARVFEFTNRGPAAEEVFAALVPFAAKELPGLLLGAGSVSDPRAARRFLRLGAQFIVGPQYVPAVRRVCRLRGVPYVPGCGTVSEVGRAQRAGCPVTKVFPGEVLGPAFVKALLAPMPWSRIMVTGGVEPTQENLEAWFGAGAVSVGMGSNLLSKDLLAAADWPALTARCRECFTIISKVKR